MDGLGSVCRRAMGSVCRRDWFGLSPRGGFVLRRAVGSVCRRVMGSVFMRVCVRGKLTIDTGVMIVGNERRVVRGLECFRRVRVWVFRGDASVGGNLFSRCARATEGFGQGTGCEITCGGAWELRGIGACPSGACRIFVRLEREIGSICGRLWEFVLSVRGLRASGVLLPWVARAGAR